MLKAITFNGTGCREGMDLGEMVKVVKAQAKANPKGTVADLPGPLCIAWSKAAGPGVAQIEHEGVTRDQEIKRATNFFVPGNSIVRLRPNDGPGVALFVTATGQYSQEPGADSAVLPPFQPKADDSPDIVAALGWLRDGRTGTSSSTLCHVLLGLPKEFSSEYYAAPLDQSDFQRCNAFFQAVPGVRSRLSEMKAVSPQWAALVDIWEELESLSGQDRHQDISQAMRQALEVPRTRTRHSP